MKKYLLIFAAVCLYIGTAAGSARAQCGAEGLDSCCGNPSRSCKKTDKSGVALSLTAEASIRKNSEVIRLQRARVERARARRKQIERVNASETARLIKSLIEYDRRSQTLNLFPVEGFTPGTKQTTYFSLVLDSEECGRLDASGNLEKCYMVNGIHFYFDRNNVSDHLFISRLRFGGMPEKWAAYGFDWDLNYNQWIRLFEKLGYKTLVTGKPSVGMRGGDKFFDAELTTLVKTPNGRMRLTLNFTNGFGKTTASDSGTLFSMVFDRVG